MVPQDIQDFYWQEFHVWIGSNLFFILFFYILISRKCCGMLVLLLFCLFIFNVDKVKFKCEYKFKKCEYIKKFHKSYIIRLFFFHKFSFFFFALFWLQKHYQWDPSLDALVKVAWRKKTSQHYRNDVSWWNDHSQRPSFI